MRSIFAKLKRYLPTKNAFLALGGLVVTILVQGLGWPIDGPTMLSFWGIVASAIYNNGKFGFDALHTPTFWLTALAAVLVFVTKGLHLVVPTTAIYGVAASIIGLIFHMGHAATAAAAASMPSTGGTAEKSSTQGG